MKLDNFTFKAQEVLADAQARAEDGHQQEIVPEHLLLALIEQKDGLTPSILKKVGADTETVRNSLRKRISDSPKVYGASQVYISVSVCGNCVSRRSIVSITPVSGNGHEGLV